MYSTGFTASMGRGTRAARHGQSGAPVPFATCGRRFAQHRAENKFGGTCWRLGGMPSGDMNAAYWFIFSWHTTFTAHYSCSDLHCLRHSRPRAHCCSFRLYCTTYLTGTHTPHCTARHTPHVCTRASRIRVDCLLYTCLTFLWHNALIQLPYARI